MVEPLVKAAYELHVTRIGGIYSVYVQTSPQEGNAVVERVEITPRNGCSKRKIRGCTLLNHYYGRIIRDLHIRPGTFSSIPKQV